MLEMEVKVQEQELVESNILRSMSPDLDSLQCPMTSEKRGREFVDSK
jgi:hypothetical protein